MLVRAKRLVFTERKPTYPGDLLIWECNTSFGLYCAWQHGETWLWDLYSGEEEIVSHNNLASLESAQAACQVDFDRRWREATEVPELVWTEGYPESKCGLYEIWDESDDDGPDFHAMRDDGSWSENYDSRELAIAACNAHNRAAVLGE